MSNTTIKAADNHEDITQVINHLRGLNGIIVDSFATEPKSATQPRNIVKMQLRLERRQYRNRILDFIGEMQGVDMLSVE